MQMFFFILTIYLLLLTTYTLQTNPPSCKSIILNSLSSSSNITRTIMSQFNTFSSNLSISSECIEQLLFHSQYETLLKYVINLTTKKRFHFKETLHNAVNNYQKKLEYIYNKYTFDDNEYQIVSPAFRWAESIDKVYIEIKYAHRHDSPGCLELENRKFVINNEGNVLYFEGDCVGTENPIKFILNITLYDKIDKQMSIGKESSVGRFVCELKKQKENVWRRLLKDEEMMNGINNMKIWFEMQERYKSEINNEDNNIDNTNNEDDDDIDKEFDKIKKQMKAEKKRNKKRKKRKTSSPSNKHINTDL